MKTRDTDILIIGSGPAGATAALRLAAHGLAPLLVDKQDSPRSKSCGDAISGDGINALHTLGLYNTVAKQANNCSEKHFIVNQGEPHVVNMETLVLPRDMFDRILVRQAVLQGAELLQAGFTGEHIYDGQQHVLEFNSAQGQPLTIRARCVLLAFGCQMDNALGDFPKRYKMAAPDQVAIRGYYRASWPIRERQYFFSRDLTPGYLWAFPMGDGLFNVGCGGKILRARHLPLQKKLDAFVAERDSVYGASGTWETPPLGGWLRTNFSNYYTFKRLPGMLPIGEVLGATYMFSGGGVGKSMKSALLAADAILSCGREEHGELISRRYYDAIGEQMLPSYHKASRICDYLLSKSIFHRFVYQKVFNNSRYPDFIPDVLCGRIQPAQIFSLQHICRLLLSR